MTERKCALCEQEATTAVRGTVQTEYLEFCSFHAGAMQMMLEKLDVSDSVKWKPLQLSGSVKN